MSWVETIKQGLPDYAKDTKLNLDAVILRSTLDPVEALKNKQITGAALDCIEGEGTIDVDIETDLLLGAKKSFYEIAEVDILSKMQNVILSPHNAFNSSESLAILRKTTAQNIHCFLSKHPQNLVKLS